MKILKLTLPAKIDSLRKTEDLIEEFAETHKLNPKTVFNLKLIIEEIVVNIASYSYKSDENGEFTLKVDCSNKNNIVLTFIDSGIPFDPTENQTVRADTLSETSPGGWGLHIVKKLSKQVKYSRENNKNVLEIVISR